MHKIIETFWFTQGHPPHSFGLTIMKPKVGRRKAYLGVIEGQNAIKDEQFIADYGAKVTADVLREIADKLEQDDAPEKDREDG